MSPPTIPQEIIDAIIGEFCHSKSDLRIFSLVCHQWLHPSRRHLFRDIYLLPPRHHHTTTPSDVLVPYSKRLYRVLQKSPHLVEYIKELDVDDGGRQDWVATDETLPFLLQMLANLEKIRFHNLNWLDFPEPLRQSICSVLELPTLSTLEIEIGHFDGMDDFGRFLCHAKHLTHLSIVYVTWGPEPGQVPEPLNQTQLVDLQLKFAGLKIFINWLLGPRSPFTVSHITVLDISGIPPCGEVINPLLHAIGGSLELCRLDVDPCESTQAPFQRGYVV
jgi:hypothetical protein